MPMKTNSDCSVVCCSPWQSCEDEANGEEIWQPEVVGGDWRVLLRLYLRLVDETAGGLWKKICTQGFLKIQVLTLPCRAFRT